MQGSMDFELNKTQKDIQKAVRDFAKGEFDKELARDLDRNHAFPAEIVQKAGDLGLIGVHFPEKYSGQGLGCFEAILVVEELCRRDSTIGSTIALASFASEIIMRYAGEETKEKYLPPVAEGRMLSTGAFAEPGNGQDITHLDTTAHKDGRKWVLNGTKTFVNNGGTANFYCVLCLTDPDATSPSRGTSLILIEAKRDGVSTEDMGAKMGFRMISTATLHLDNVRVPLNNLIGEEGKGYNQTLHFFEESRIQLAAQALGIAQGAYDRALDYTKKREQFGKKLVGFQTTRHKLADMVTKIELARLITYKAAWNFDRGRNDPKISAMAKWYAARVAVEIADEAIQLLGGYGYMTEYDVERFYRDAKITELFEGPQSIHKDTVAGAVVGRFR
jgi:alkylation response protein AidB-like acyl-CoA dehydrogenase